MKQAVRVPQAQETIIVRQPAPAFLHLVDAEDSVWVVGEQKPKSKLAPVAIGYCGIIVLLWFLETYIAEKTMITAMLAYTVQPMFLVPSFVLLAVSLVKRNNRAALHSLFSAVLVVLLLMRPTISFASAHTTGGTPVRVMQYNVDKWDDGPAAIASAIKQVNPDIFCLEEADNYFYSPAGATILPTLLRGYHWSHINEVVIGSKYPIVAARVKGLTPLDAYRTVSCVDVKTKAGIVTIMACHFKAIEWTKPGTWPALTRERMTEVASLRRVIQSTKRSWILAGDLNLQPVGLAYGSIADLGTDAFTTAGHGFGYTARTQIPCARIDHIFLGPRIAACHTWTPPIHDSDHLPLVSDVVLQ